MKKKLLLVFMPMLLFSVASEAQIKYWDFGGKDLGAGYDNMLPVEYMNAWSANRRFLSWVDSEGNTVTAYADGVGYAVSDNIHEYENGESVQSVFNDTFNGLYSPESGYTFQLASGKDDGNGGIYISGGSAYTKPTLLPDLDGDTNMSFLKDSDSDRLITVNHSLTRYDERTAMPNGEDVNLLPGYVQFVTPGDKRYNSTRGRGFGMDLAAGEYLTVIGSGQYVDIEGDGEPYINGCSTGWFSFESMGGSGTPIKIENKGTGVGDLECGGLSGGDTGDESIRVMEFQAGTPPAGQTTQTYRFTHRGGTVRIYRMYLSSTSIKSQVEEALLGVDDVAKTVSTDIKAIGNRVYVSNVKSNTEINIYSITGALVKSLKTDIDTDFDFNSGLFIATIKTAEGQKSVKFVTK